MYDNVTWKVLITGAVGGRLQKPAVYWHEVELPRMLGYVRHHFCPFLSPVSSHPYHPSLFRTDPKQPHYAARGDDHSWHSEARECPSRLGPALEFEMLTFTHRTCSNLLSCLLLFTNQDGRMQNRSKYIKIEHFC